MLSEKTIYYALYESPTCLKTAMYAYQRQSRHPQVFAQLKTLCLRLVQGQNLPVVNVSDSCDQRLLDSFRQVCRVLHGSVSSECNEFRILLRCLDAHDMSGFLSALIEWVLTYIDMGAKTGFRQALYATLSDWPQLPSLVESVPRQQRFASPHKVTHTTASPMIDSKRSVSRSSRSYTPLKRIPENASDGHRFTPYTPKGKPSSTRSDVRSRSVTQPRSPSVLSDLTESDNGYSYTSPNSQSTVPYNALSHEASRLEQYESLYGQEGFLAALVAYKRTCGSRQDEVELRQGQHLSNLFTAAIKGEHKPVASLKQQDLGYQDLQRAAEKISRMLVACFEHMKKTYRFNRDILDAEFYSHFARIQRIVTTADYVKFCQAINAFLVRVAEEHPHKTPMPQAFAAMLEQGLAAWQPVLKAFQPHELSAKAPATLKPSAEKPHHRHRVVVDTREAPQVAFLEKPEGEQPGESSLISREQWLVTHNRLQEVEAHNARLQQELMELRAALIPSSTPVVELVAPPSVDLTCAVLEPAEPVYTLKDLVYLYKDKVDDEGNVLAPAMATFDEHGNFVMDHQRLQALLTQVCTGESAQLAQYKTLGDGEYDIARYLTTFNGYYIEYAIETLELSPPQFLIPLTKAFGTWQGMYREQLSAYLDRRPRVAREAADIELVVEVGEVEVHTAAQKQENLNHFHQLYQAIDGQTPIFHFDTRDQFTIDYPRLYAFVDALAIKRDLKEQFKQRIDSLIDLLTQDRDVSSLLDNVARALKKVFKSYMVEERVEKEFWVTMRGARVSWANYYDQSLQHYRYTNFEAGLERPNTPQRRAAIHSLRRADLKNQLQESPFYESGEHEAEKNLAESGRRLSIAERAQHFKSFLKVNSNFVCDLYRPKSTLIPKQSGLSLAKNIKIDKGLKEQLGDVMIEPALLQVEQGTWTIRYVSIEKILKDLCAEAKVDFSHVQQRYMESRHSLERSQDLSVFIEQLNGQIYSLLAILDDHAVKANFGQVYRKWYAENKSQIPLYSSSKPVPVDSVVHVVDSVENDHGLQKPTHSVLAQLFQPIGDDTLSVVVIAEEDLAMASIPVHGSSHVENSIESVNQMPLEDEVSLLTSEMDALEEMKWTREK